MTTTSEVGFSIEFKLIVQAMKNEMRKKKSLYQFKYSEYMQLSVKNTPGRTVITLYLNNVIKSTYFHREK